MRALSVSSAVVVAAALATVFAACAVTPAAASLLHPPQPVGDAFVRPGHRAHQVRRHSRHHRASISADFEALGDATVQWKFNASWEPGVAIANVRRSEVEPDTVIAYANAYNGNNATSGYLFALNATNGAELWMAHFTTHVPGWCENFVETATTVACVGAVKYAIANRTTGVAVAEGEYAKGCETWFVETTVFGAPIYSARHGDVLAIALLNMTGYNTTKVVALNLVTGAITPMGEVSTGAGRQFLRGFAGSLRAVAPSGELHWTFVMWAMNDTYSATCNEMVVANFSTTGKAASTTLAAPVSNAGTSFYGGCAQPYPFAFPDEDLLLTTPDVSSTVVRAFRLNGTLRNIIQLPTAKHAFPQLLMPIRGADGAIESLVVKTRCELASVNWMNNLTNWAFDSCPLLNAALLRATPKFVTVGSPVAKHVVNISTANGLTTWHTALSMHQGCGYALQETADVDVFLCTPNFTFVRKSDGAHVAAVDTAKLWSDFVWPSDFYATPGAPAGAGTLVVGGQHGTVMSVAVTPKL